MPYTLTSNHNISGFIEQAEKLIHTLELSPDKKYLFLSLFGPIKEYIPSLLKNISKDYDFLVIIFPYESPDWYKCIRPLYEIVNYIGKCKFSIIDCGKPLYHCVHFLHNPFVNEDHISWTPNLFTNRKYYFVCANRVMKLHRIKLLNQIYNLDTELKIITAGNFNIDQYFDLPLNFPYPLSAPDEKLILDADFNSQRFVPNSFKNCIFNVVTESSYENIGDVFETWSRIMITEKSIRPFRLHQLPIFLAPAGHVAYLRQLEFDLYDDLIDHTYDQCTDPNKRIDMVADQIRNLISKPIDYWIKICDRNLDRFEYNRTHCDHVKKTLDINLVNNFNIWAAS